MIFDSLHFEEMSIDSPTESEHRSNFHPQSRLDPKDPTQRYQNSHPSVESSIDVRSLFEYILRLQAVRHDVHEEQEV